MKHTLSIIVLFLIISFFSCRKDKIEVVYGTIQQQGGCLSAAWLVEIENPDPGKQAFICSQPSTSSSVYACSHSVFIVNLPEEFKVAGRKIKFSKWTEQGSCLSSSYAPHQIEVKDVSVD